MAHEKTPSELGALLRLPGGPVDLSRLDTRATPGADDLGKAGVAKATATLAEELGDLQERLFANGRAAADDTAQSAAPRVLLVLQGMDTSGKGGVIRHAIGLVDPQGVRITSFKKPTAEERSHEFLWRIERALPGPGMIGIFDRSHYEDVLVVRVDQLVEEDVWAARYDAINAWEAKLVGQGVRIIKCFLHISADEQKERLLARLDAPDKHWKYNPGDIDAREKWPAYVEAYEAVLERCHTAAAPWYVIPSDRKWYRNWAVAQLLTEQLRSLDLNWPAGDFDVEVERSRLLSE